MSCLSSHAAGSSAETKKRLRDQAVEEFAPPALRASRRLTAMASKVPATAKRIEFSKEETKAMVADLRRYFTNELDQELGQLAG